MFLNLLTCWSFSIAKIWQKSDGLFTKTSKETGRMYIGVEVYELCDDYTNGQ
jgi:hypothetical protein